MRFITLISALILALGTSGLLTSSALADPGQQKASSEAADQIEKTGDATTTPPVEAAPPAAAEGDTETTPAEDKGEAKNRAESDTN